MGTSEVVYVVAICWDEYSMMCLSFLCPSFLVVINDGSIIDADQIVFVNDHLLLLLLARLLNEWLHDWSQSVIAV